MARDHLLVEAITKLGITFTVDFKAWTTPSKTTELYPQSTLHGAVTPAPTLWAYNRRHGQHKLCGQCWHQKLTVQRAAAGPFAVNIVSMACAFFIGRVTQSLVAAGIKFL